MKFTNFYNVENSVENNVKKLIISFEVFPPKDLLAVDSLLVTLRDLKKFSPAFISVTYGAGGSTQTWTRDLAIKIQKEIQTPAAFHFTCVGSNQDQIREYVQNLNREGLNLIVALRGDPPAGAKTFVPAPDGFKYASQLVEFLKNVDSRFSLAVAGYPEGHVEATSLEDDLVHLKEKVEAGADVILTQFFFDNQDYFNFVDRARKMGITIPIIPGILPVLNLKQVERMSKLSGTKFPQVLQDQLTKVENNPDAMREVGINWALNQCIELKKKKVPGIHFYILNKSYSVQKILEELAKQ